jgi:hypothetical protein
MLSAESITVVIRVLKGEPLAYWSFYAHLARGLLYLSRTLTSTAPLDQDCVDDACVNLCSSLSHELLGDILKNTIKIYHRCKCHIQHLYIPLK